MTIGDARGLPFEDAGFDLVTLFTVLSSLANGTHAELALRQAFRVVSPGGLLVVWEPRLPNPLNPHTVFIGDRILNRALAAARRVKFEPRPFCRRWPAGSALLPTPRTHCSPGSRRFARTGWCAHGSRAAHGLIRATNLRPYSERSLKLTLTAILGAAITCGCLVALALGSGRPPAVAPATAAGPTIVSLEFDHALSDALPGVELANSLGMKVTLFALSGRIGLPGYMTVAQLQQLQDQGDEIGGHTIDHKDLSQLPRAAQRHEICGDRAALEADGLDVTDFAYPYGHFNAATPGIVRSCGYQSARGAGGLASPGGCYGPCRPSRASPPRIPGSRAP